MKYIFIKSGGYTEPYGRKLGGDINDILNTELFHFTKDDSTFKLNYIDGEYRIHQSRADVLDPKNPYTVIDFETVVSKLDEYEVIYAGCDTDFNEVISQTDLIKNFKLMSLNSNKQLVNAVTGEVINKQGVIPLIVTVRMNNTNGYAAFLTSLTHLENIQSLTRAEPQQVSPNLKAIYADDGQSFRHYLVDFKFTNVVKSFFEENVSTDSVIFVQPNQTVSIDLFNQNNGTDAEFFSGFNVAVDSNFACQVNNGVVSFETGETASSGYLTIDITGNRFYSTIVESVPRERLTFKLLVVKP